MWSDDRLPTPIPKLFLSGFRLGALQGEDMMSRFGNVWDSAAMENFFSSLKSERIGGRGHRTRDDARAHVFDHIERS